MMNSCIGGLSRFLENHLQKINCSSLTDSPVQEIWKRYLEEFLLLFAYSFGQVSEDPGLAELAVLQTLLLRIEQDPFY